MAQPKASSYRNALDNLPDEFKEDVVIVRRDESSRDEYNKAVMSEAEATVRGRVEMLTGANRIVEQGGIREQRQARVFLKADDVATPRYPEIQDHVKLRGREFAIIEEPQFTHLQLELLVQEVIPNG